MFRFIFTRTSKIIYPLIVLFFVFLFIFPKNKRFNYEYKKGEKWNYENLIAQFDFPILKNVSQLQEERALEYSNPIIAYYKFSDNVYNKTLKDIDNLDFGDTLFIKNRLKKIFSSIYSKGVLSDEDFKMLNNDNSFSSQIVFIQKNKRAAKFPLSEVLKQEDAKLELSKLLSEEFDNNVNVDSVLKSVAFYDLLTHNLDYDEQMSKQLHSKYSYEPSPTEGIMNAGQLIVSHDEIITAEIVQLLDSYKHEYITNVGEVKATLQYWLGNIFLALIMVLVVFFTIYFSKPSVLDEYNRYLYLLFITLITAVISLLVKKVAGSEFLYMAPLTFPALYTQAFFKNKEILPLCFVSLLPLLIFNDTGIGAFVIFLFANIVTLYSFKYFNRGWKQFINSFIVFATMLSTYFALYLLNIVNGDVYRDIIFLLTSSFLSIAVYPLIFLFERMFNLLSISRLQELCETNNNKLLRLLEAKAPGTFQHSLQVMNMADVAARAIDANAVLVRAGALYHDIGKMANPYCFIENESLIPEEQKQFYHRDLSPEESAKDIIKHVSDGLELAEKYGLPSLVRDFIVTHHGTSVTEFFYNKYVNEGGNPDDRKLFTYPGVEPFTKEQMILMLCDTLEAASRTLKDYSPKSFSDLVERVVDMKMSSGQFENNKMSLRELNIVKESLKNYLSQISHQRIVYPKRKR